MPIFDCNSTAVSASDNIIPANFVLGPNEGRQFYIRATVEFFRRGEINPYSTDTTGFSIPTEELVGMTRATFGLLFSILHPFGSPPHAFMDICLQLMNCSRGIIADPENEGKMVLPIDVLITCVQREGGDDDEEEEEEEEGAQVVVETVEEGGVVCSVCMEEIEVGKKAARLPCMHRYHERCIEVWLDLNPSCPYCRRQL